MPSVWVDDLSAAIGNDVEKDKYFAMLVSSIKSTMSDLGPVNPGFNSQFQLLRQTLLPKAMENWNILSVEQKQQLTDMANFFGKVHVLANFATDCDKVLKQFESMMTIIIQFSHLIQRKVVLFALFRPHVKHSTAVDLSDLE